MDIGFDYTAAKFWLDVAVTIFAAGAGMYAYLRTRHTANANDIRVLREWVITELTQRDTFIKLMDKRITIVERDVQHAPTHAQIAEVHDRLTLVGKELSEVVGQMKAYNKQVGMINEYLLRQSNRSS